MISLDLSQVISQLLAFVIMIVVLKRYGWKPISDLLDKRKEKIAAEFASIDTQKSELKKLIGDYQLKLKAFEADMRIKEQKERQKWEEKGSQHLSEAKNQAKEIIQKASMEADLQAAHAESELKNKLADWVLQATEKMVEERMKDPEKQKEMAEKFLQEVEKKP